MKVTSPTYLLWEHIFVLNRTFYPYFNRQIYFSMKGQNTLGFKKDTSLVYMQQSTRPMGEGQVSLF